jgi:hypothetical protein
MLSVHGQGTWTKVGDESTFPGKDVDPKNQTDVRGRIEATSMIEQRFHHYCYHPHWASFQHGHKHPLQAIILHGLPFSKF